MFNFLNRYLLLLNRNVLNNVKSLFTFGFMQDLFTKKRSNTLSSRNTPNCEYLNFTSLKIRNELHGKQLQLTEENFSFEMYFRTFGENCYLDVLYRIILGINFLIQLKDASANVFLELFIFC